MVNNIEEEQAGEVVSKKGWLKKKAIIFKSQARWFEVDKSTEYVTYFSNDTSLGPMFSSLKGTFSLEKAQLDMRDTKSSPTEYQIMVKTNNGKKFKLSTHDEVDRNEWYQIFTQTRDFSVSAENLLNEFKARDDPLDCKMCIDGFSIDDDDGIDDDTEEGATYDGLFTLPVQDIKGNFQEFQTLLGDRCTVFILLRHFGCMLCRYSAGLFSALKQEFDALGIDLVAFGNGTPLMANTFKREQGFRGKLMVDQKRQVYQALNCLRGMKYSLSFKTFASAKLARQNGYKQGERQGDLYQLGGVFVISKKDGIIYSRVDRYAGDFPDPNEILNTCKAYVDKCDDWSTKKQNKENPSIWKDHESEKDSNLIKSGNGYHLEKEIENQQKIDFSLVDRELDTRYYQQVLYNKPHTNYVIADTIDPTIISISEAGTGKDAKSIIRTRKADIRVLIPAKFATSYPKMLSYIKKLPASDPVNYPFSISQTVYKSGTVELEKDLLYFEEQEFISCYKFGLLYIKKDQINEIDFFQNENSKKFDNFVQILGDKILLKGHDSYKGGLDVQNDKTGINSIFTIYKFKEIMFHVSTYLPNQKEDLQRLERKRHIGNDLVVLIFKEGNQLFDSTSIASHFNHIFIVVSIIKEDNQPDKYEVSIISKPDVQPFPPFLPSPPIFEDKSILRKFLLSKMINGERCALKSVEFRNRRFFTRKGLLNDIIQKNMEITKNLSKSESRRVKDVTSARSSHSELSLKTSNNSPLKSSSRSASMSNVSSSVQSATDSRSSSDEITIEEPKQKKENWYKDDTFNACVELKKLVTGFPVNKQDYTQEQYEEKFTECLHTLEENLEDQITVAKLTNCCQDYINNQRKERNSVMMLEDIQKFVEAEQELTLLVYEILTLIKKKFH